MALRTAFMFLFILITNLVCAENSQPETSQEKTEVPPMVIRGRNVQWIAAEKRLEIEKNVKIECNLEENTSGSKDNSVSANRIIITSDGSGTMNQNTGIAVFKDNVEIKDNNTLMKAHTVKAYIDPQTKKLLKVNAYGNVCIEQASQTSQSRKAVYNVPRDEIVLSGNPKILYGYDCYTAEFITLYDKGKRVVFEPEAQLIVYEETSHEETSEDNVVKENVSDAGVTDEILVEDETNKDNL